METMRTSYHLIDAKTNVMILEIGLNDQRSISNFGTYFVHIIERISYSDEMEPTVERQN